MSRFTQIDLSQLPVPDVVEMLDFEAIVDELRAWLVAAMPDLAPALALESEPMVKVLEAFAYRELILRGRINDAARATMLATATGADLDNLAALLGVARQLITPADTEASPPVAAVHEEDAALRYRAQLALEGFTTAGPVGAYEFHARAASGQVADVDVASPAPGDVVVTVLSREASGIPDATLLATVEAALNADEVRPLGTRLTVAPATRQDYTVNAILHIAPGPDATVVVEAAYADAVRYIESCRALGGIVARAGLLAALWQGGITRIDLTEPAVDVICPSTAAPRCMGIAVTRAAT